MTAYKPHEFAKLLGVTVKTLQRCDNIGRLKTYHSTSNHRYYTDEHLTSIIHVFLVVYTAYENTNQKSKIKNQNR